MSEVAEVLEHTNTARFEAGGGVALTVTEALREMLPPAPLQDRVNVPFAVSTPVL